MLNDVFRGLSLLEKRNDAKSVSDQTPLHGAHRDTVVRLLLDHGADVNQGQRWRDSINVSFALPLSSRRCVLIRVAASLTERIHHIRTFRVLLKNGTALSILTNGNERWLLC